MRRAVRRADRRAKLHEGLRRLGTLPGGVDLRKGGGIILFDRGLCDGALVRGQAGDDAEDIAVDGGRGQAEADGANCSGGIVADAGQGADLVIVRRERAAIVRDDLLRGLLQVAHAGIVAEALPELVQPVGVARGEGRNVRKLGEETGIVALHGLDARLLEHDLGEPDVIGFAVTPPGQVAFVPFIPAEQRREKCGR